MIHARFFFDAGSGGVLWANEPAAWEQWGNPADLDKLPLSVELRAELQRLADLYDTSLNWDYPSDPGPWREPECTRFNADARAALAKLRAELGTEWLITDEFDDLNEDPDLDRYLADPGDFQR